MPKKICTDCMNSFGVLTVYDECFEDDENSKDDFVLCKLKCLNCGNIFLKNLDFNFLEKLQGDQEI